MNVVNEIQRINDLELEKGLTHTSASWHDKYKDSAWIHAGNLPLNLTEGDVLCILSQYGEIDDIHLVRDKDSGKSKGFAFVKYEDARSCVLAVDNLCGSMVLGRTLRVDHVENYRLPKHIQEKEDGLNKEGDEEGSSSGVAEAGHAYVGLELASSFNIHSGQDLFAAPKPDPKIDDLGDEMTGDVVIDKGMDKEERRVRKEERAQKRREKEEHRRKKEERKRRKHDLRS
jgi:RNA-binding motif X-linked protein 2|eukprot:scaffold2690_cov283-Alexandrium_tamarense.AAC.2